MTRPLVRQFRQILLWPLQLMPIKESAQIQNHWEVLERPDRDNPWFEAPDAFDEESGQLQERQYAEFVTFLPYVQRMLYGEGKERGSTSTGESPIRVFRRADVRTVRVCFPGDEDAQVFEVARADLYFFHDIDVALLVVEIAAEDVPFALVQQALYRFGRSYPTFWTPQGLAGHCPVSVEWLDAEGTVLAGSDYEKRDKYLAYAGRYRSPCISAHWEFLLRPPVPLIGFPSPTRPSKSTRAGTVSIATGARRSPARPARACCAAVSPS